MLNSESSDRKPSGANWRLLRFVVVLFLLAILLSNTLPGCRTPAPEDSPIEARTLTEVPGAIGYFAFPVSDGATHDGIVMIREELRAVSGTVLATREITAPASVSSIVTDVIAPRVVSPPWPIVFAEPAVEYARAEWQIAGGWAIAGQWYADLNTPVQPEIDGWYRTRDIGAYRYYLPVVVR